MGLNALRPIQSEPSKYGLLNSKTLVGDTGERWVSGFDQASLACRANVDLVDTCNADATYDVVTRQGSGSIGDYLPFTVRATVECTTIGGLQTDWQNIALLALAECEQKAIEKEFWEGRLAQAANSDSPGSNPNRYLADGSATDVTPTPGTAIKVRYGLALLEQALAAAGCGGRGFIHVSRGIGSLLPVHDRDDDGVLETHLGNYVIAGDGYSGSSTDGTPASGTTEWMYATGPVFVRLDDPFVVSPDMRQNINTSVNTIEVAAERTASVVWDGCAHFRVLVDMSLDYA